MLHFSQSLHLRGWETSLEIAVKNTGGTVLEEVFIKEIRLPLGVRLSESSARQGRQSEYERPANRDACEAHRGPDRQPPTVRARHGERFRYNPIALQEAGLTLTRR